MQNTLPAPINEKIKTRRLELKLSEAAAAHQARLSIYEYGDIECYADEVFTSVPLYHVKKICTSLKIDFLAFLEIPCAFCSDKKDHSDDYWLRRNSLIKKRREIIGLSPEDLGNKVGFNSKEVDLIETYTAHLESWAIEKIFELAAQIQIPPQVLLDVQCQTCGR